MAKHEWKVERLKPLKEEPDLICLNCGTIQLPENDEDECVPSKAWKPELESWE